VTCYPGVSNVNPAGLKAAQHDEREYIRHLGWLDPRLALDEQVAGNCQPKCTIGRGEKIAPRQADDYKRKGG
jgi:hypothetical protein